LEQEIKLTFDDVEAARRAVHAAGGRLDVAARLIDDQLFDTPDGQLRRAGTGLRVRRDGARTLLTFKGPVQPGPVKSREELETEVADPDIVEGIVRGVGFHPVFRGQKRREEYRIEAAHVMIDETPMGVFVEIEADPDAIARVAAALGRSARDYRLESYPTLWRAWCDRTGLGDPRAMLFDAPARRSSDA
jgi:adenylate cyclase class 2